MRAEDAAPRSRGDQAVQQRHTYHQRRPARGSSFQSRPTMSSATWTRISGPRTGSGGKSTSTSSRGACATLPRARADSLDPDQLTELARCMTDALDHLHHRDPKIIHRDIKPANILLRSSSPFRAVLADFGLAILTDSTMTMRTNSRTEAYASPEAAAGDTRPARDWWSLGMTLAELAAGRHPYQLEDGRFLQEGSDSECARHEAGAARPHRRPAHCCCS